MRLRMRLLACLTVCAAGCKPTFTEHLDVTVQLGTGLSSRCVRVTASSEGVESQESEPMRVGDKTSLRVLVHREKFPASVTLQARGFSDENCATLTSPPEQSPATTAEFARRTVTLNVERGTAVDLDSDGFSPPADCNDQDPAVKPGVAERCSDGIDNDCSAGADCADPNCHMAACGNGARCTALTCTEDVCSDNVDGDGDGQVDCADTDCNGLACGTGTGASCTGPDCLETACGDGVDNDEDSLTDCQEPSCAGATCGMGGRCVNLTCEEPNESVCGDGQDNDMDSRIDCADPDCNTRLCSDGNRCTTGETCSGTTCGGGAPVLCNQRPGQCFQANGTCSMATGLCVYPPENTSTACNDNDPCTTPDRCAGDGGCASSPVTCAPPPGACFGQGICQPSLDGGCAYAVLTAAPCSDSNNCTMGDSCGADGGCQGGVTTTCNPPECKLFVEGNCESDGGCIFTNAPVNTVCSTGRCNGSGTCVTPPAFPYAADNIDPANHLPSTVNAFTVDCALTFNSGPDAGFSALCPGMTAPAVSFADGGSSGELAVISVPSLSVTSGGSLTLTGARPVVLLVWGDAGVNGPIFANSSAARPGPGAIGALGCGSRTGGDGRPAGAQNGGGGGGGFGTVGGSGGGGNNTASSGGDAGVSGTGGDVPLLVGCPGGRGKTDNSFTPGGVGGGALQLTVGGNLTIDSIVTVSGQGGFGGDEGDEPGGGGGGSGGALVIQARQLSLSANARLTSNGGAGGGGADNGTGDPGSDGSTNTDNQAPKGAKEGGGGDGAPGGAGTALPGNGVTAGKGGGGGGGAVGRIFLKNMQGTGCSVNGSALISPSPSRMNCP